MALTVRPTPYVVPAYSLTGDLLSYLRCGLQYRYYNRGSLPPSKPVQLWFGQFIHGVMEEAYRTWKSIETPLPWSDKEILPIVELIIRRLAARGVPFYRYQLLGIAVERAFASINIWGPYLFPLIEEAEVRLRGIRQMPDGTITIRQSNYYEVEGVVDVITSVRLSSGMAINPIVGALLEAIAPQLYEIVVDYKGMRRPSMKNLVNDTWEHHEWQVLTYAWLREQQPKAPEVRSGILLYLNELVPGIEDMDKLEEEVLGNGRDTTDMQPSYEDLEVLRKWPQIKARWRQEQVIWVDRVRDWWRSSPNQRQAFPRMPEMSPSLSLDYRKNRSFRVIPVNSNMIIQSLDEFDQVVAKIEGSVAKESNGCLLTKAWTPYPRDETCTVCDFRTFCPDPKNRYHGVPKAP